MTYSSATGAQVSQTRLEMITTRAVGRPALWQDLVRYDPDRRWYRRISQHEDYEIWLLSWLPGQETGFHDHGASAGAFTVARGSLLEIAAPGGRPNPRRTLIAQGTARSFGPGYLHNVRNETTGPAVSIHAYSPPLVSMRRFALDADGQLRITSEERAW